MNDLIWLVLQGSLEMVGRPPKKGPKISIICLGW